MRDIGAEVETGQHAAELGGDLRKDRRSRGQALRRRRHPRGLAVRQERRCRKSSIMAPEAFLDVMDANVTQSWLMARAAGKQMLAQGDGGKIVLMSSARGLLGHPAGYTAYCASKSAIDGITKALGCEWGTTGITVNAIAPTVFRSPLTAWMFERQRARQPTLRRLSRPRAERAARRTGRSRRTAPLPRLQGVGLLHRPYPLRRRRLHGGMTMAAERIAILGGGLMGHGIAQVFALAGHRVKITDPSAEARSRYPGLASAPTCDDLGARSRALSSACEPSVDLTDAVRRRRLGGRGGAGKSRAQAEDIRGGRAPRAARRNTRLQHLRHSDQPRSCQGRAARTRARHALVEPAVSSCRWSK